DALVRAWRGRDRFEGRAAIRSWLYRIATNVCIDMLNSKERRIRPMDLGPAKEPVVSNLHERAETTWLEPIPTELIKDPAEVAVERESIRLAFVAALQQMPPYDMWLSGRDDIFRWWFGPGIGCKGSRVLPAISANGMPTYGQYKPSPQGGHEPWALQVIELSGGRISELTFFLDTARLFPLFGLPPRLDA